MVVVVEDDEEDVDEDMVNKAPIDVCFPLFWLAPLIWFCDKSLEIIFLTLLSLTSGWSILLGLFCELVADIDDEDEDDRIEREDGEVWAVCSVDCWDCVGPERIGELADDELNEDEPDEDDDDFGVGWL